MTKIWKNVFNAKDFTPLEGVINDEASMTQPGQAMTVSELIQRFNSGLKVDQMDMEYLENETPLPLIRDLTDINTVNNYLNDVELKVKTAQDKKIQLEQERKLQREKEFNDAVEKKFRELNNTKIIPE